MERLVSVAVRPELPVVVSDVQEYMQAAHYAKAPQRFLAIVDSPSTVAYTRSDSADLQMAALKCCLPLQVYPFREFAGAAPDISFVFGRGGLGLVAGAAGSGRRYAAVDRDRRQRKIYLVKLK